MTPFYKKIENTAGGDQVTGWPCMPQRLERSVETNFHPNLSIIGICDFETIPIAYRKFLLYENFENSKHQESNPKQIPIAQIQNSKNDPVTAAVPKGIYPFDRSLTSDAMPLLK
jgi:hypothetical protein